MTLWEKGSISQVPSVTQLLAAQLWPLLQFLAHPSPSAQLDLAALPGAGL